MISIPEPTGAEDNELDLALAAELQAGMLASRSCAMLRNHTAAVQHRMCGSIGGDFCDVIRINDDQAAVVIGDVMGHGVRACLLMARILWFLRSDPAVCSRPGQAVETLNRMLLDLGDRVGSSLPVTLFLATLDEPSGVSFFVNAGQPMPVIHRKNGVCPVCLCAQGVPLGLGDYRPREGCHSLEPGERMILFTDGILDAANPHGQRFGDRRLAAAIARHADDEADPCARGIMQAVEDFRHGARQSDDETLIVIDRAIG